MFSSGFVLRGLTEEDLPGRRCSILSDQEVPEWVIFFSKKKKKDLVAQTVVLP